MAPAKMVAAAETDLAGIVTANLRGLPREEDKEGVILRRCAEAATLASSTSVLRSRASSFLIDCTASNLREMGVGGGSPLEDNLPEIAAPRSTA